MRTLLTLVTMVTACSGEMAPPSQLGDAGFDDGGDGAGEMQLRALAAVNVCEPDAGGSPFRVVSGDADSLRYSCAAACAQADPLGCSVGSSTNDGTGLPMRELFFVTDAMAGTLRYRDVEGPTFVWHPGGWGTEWFGDPLIRAVESTAPDVRTAQVRWEPGYRQGTGLLGELGWITRRDGSPATLAQLAVRPASILGWIADHLGDGQHFGYGGCSGGALAAFAAATLYQTRDVTDYVVLLGGPPIGDLGFVCGTASGPGWCEDEPNMACQSDADCPGAENLCMTRTVTPLLAAQSQMNMDYVHLTDACSSHRATDLPASLISEPDLRWDNPYRIDFVIDTGPAPLSDGRMSAGGIAAEYHNRLLGPTQWTVNRTYTHCASESDGTLAPQLSELIAEAMH